MIDQVEGTVSTEVKPPHSKVLMDSTVATIKSIAWQMDSDPLKYQAPVIHNATLLLMRVSANLSPAEGLESMLKPIATEIAHLTAIPAGPLELTDVEFTDFDRISAQTLQLVSDLSSAQDCSMGNGHYAILTRQGIERAVKSHHIRFLMKDAGVGYDPQAFNANLKIHDQRSGHQRFYRVSHPLKQNQMSGVSKAMRPSGVGYLKTVTVTLELCSHIGFTMASHLSSESNGTVLRKAKGRALFAMQDDVFPRISTWLNPYCKDTTAASWTKTVPQLEHRVLRIEDCWSDMTSEDIEDIAYWFIGLCLDYQLAEGTKVSKAATIEIEKDDSVETWLGVEFRKV